ncbi:MAG TPA: class I SAM-dependent methyltransferase [Candidatus Limnocylindria bacterium]|nr:class I SAM-dependent methyltransferase [Candidatus Limnocylindria bacterium]
MEASPANQAQIDYWNGPSGTKWTRQQAELDRLLDELGRAAMDRLDPPPGARVIDVGCGCGATTLALAERVGARGRVLGVDVSAPMLERARERARSLANVELVQADAQTYPFEPGAADALYSRFGVMFFADPTVAFANLRRGLRPGGALAFICWQELTKNPWCLVTLGALAHHVPLPPPPAPGEPGPFSFGDAARVRGILEGAGWTEIELTAHEQALSLGMTGTLDDAARFSIETGPASRFLVDVAPDVIERVRDAVREALAPFEGPDGVRVGGACWIVSARNPS